MAAPLRESSASQPQLELVTPQTGPWPDHAPRLGLVTPQSGPWPGQAPPAPALSRSQRIAVAMVPVGLLAVIAYLALDLWSQIPPAVAPRHRAEAVCFALAGPDPTTGARFTPPMRIEPSAALLRNRLTPGTAAAVALRQTMRLDESMVMEESQRTVGDYDVSVLWLDLPPQGATAGRHWLVLTWSEGADLAVCNFRFASAPGEPASHQVAPLERRWGDRLLARVLRAQNFRAASLPQVALRVPRGSETMPVFGPRDAR